jgi:hypothetical protein
LDDSSSKESASQPYVQGEAGAALSFVNRISCDSSLEHINPCGQCRFEAEERLNLVRRWPLPAIQPSVTLKIVVSLSAAIGTPIERGPADTQRRGPGPVEALAV